MQVRCKFNGSVRFGTVPYRQSEDVPAGHTEVEDAVYPVSYLVPNADVTEVKWQTGRHTDFGFYFYADAVHDYRAVAHAMAVAMEPPGDGVVAGRLFNVSVGDGYAYYIVTDVKRINCVIEYRGFGFDDYTDRLFRHGGQFRKKDVEPFIRSVKGLDALFGRKKENLLTPVEVFKQMARSFEERHGELPKVIQEGLSKVK